MIRKSAEPQPDVQLDRAQVAQLCGLSNPKVLDTYRRRGIFPDPDGVMGRSPWWWQSTVVRWKAQRRHRGYSPDTHTPREHDNGQAPAHVSHQSRSARSGRGDPPARPRSAARQTG